MFEAAQYQLVLAGVQYQHFNIVVSTNTLSFMYSGQLIMNLSELHYLVGTSLQSSIPVPF